MTTYQCKLFASVIFVLVVSGCGGGGSEGQTTQTTTPPGTSAQSVNLNVALAGSGRGSVVSQPTGISCGTSCSTTISAGTSVALTATPVAGSVFSGWSGACSGTSTTCTVQVNVAMTVTAAFASQQFGLTVGLLGGGSGVVSSLPAGINCGATCSGAFDAGTSVALTAAPVAGSAFSGWSGACTGTSATCTVTVNAVSGVSASFSISNAVPATTWKKVAAGTAHTCALTTAGSAQCWGKNDFGQLGNGTTAASTVPMAVSGLSSGATDIVAGNSHSCAISSTGAVLCWGYNRLSQLGIGTADLDPHATPVAVTGLTSVVVTTISAGGNYTCGLTNSGAVYCWGNASTTSTATATVIGQLTSNVTAIATGSDHACAVTAGGAVVCWGANATGQLGIGNSTQLVSSTPLPVVGLGSGVFAVAAGAGHSCALKNSGDVVCWGANASGQLGNGGTAPSSTPVAVTGLSISGFASGVVAIAARGDHTCALSNSGIVKCWGANASGELGSGSTTNSTAAVAVAGYAGSAAAIATGTGYTCAVNTAGALQCWGLNSDGQLGNGSTSSASTPVPVSSPTNGGGGGGASGGASGAVARLSANAQFACAISSVGAAKCWGGNAATFSGSTTSYDSDVALTVTGLTTGSVAVNVGDGYGCSIDSSGALLCWGDSYYGDVGTGDPAHHFYPSAIRVSATSEKVSQVAAGQSYTCALSQRGAALCWGDNVFGQLGNGSGMNSATAVPVIGLTQGVMSITAGFEHACALTSVGSVQCWGGNQYGEIGGGSIGFNQFTPKTVAGLPNSVAVSAGEYHTCSISSTGGVLCWGRNATGQLGNGTTVSSLIPVGVLGLSSGAVAISSGFDHTCALIQDGTVRCWGANKYGQLGNGTLADTSLPVTVQGLRTGIVAIAAGGSFTCAMDRAGAVQCWGDNARGTLGNGAAAYQPSAVPVDVVGLP